MIIIILNSRVLNFPVAKMSFFWVNGHQRLNNSIDYLLEESFNHVKKLEVSHCYKSELYLY